MNNTFFVLVVNEHASPLVTRNNILSNRRSNKLKKYYKSAQYLDCVKLHRKKLPLLFAENTAA